jgi:HD-like signal output (HDOD) protein
MSRETFWSESLKCAGYSMWLALAVGLDESEAWLTGILLRLGEVLVAQLDNSDAVPTAARPASPGSRWQQEREQVGFDDGQLMAEAAKLWYFPQNIVNALHDCSSPLSAAKFAPLAAVIHLAAILSEREPADDSILECLPADLVSKLGIDTGWIAQYLPDPASFTDTSML